MTSKKNAKRLETRRAPSSAAASRARAATSRQSQCLWRLFDTPIRAVGILALAAVSTTVSQLALSPVYGSIPSDLFHFEATTATVLLALLSKLVLKRPLFGSVGRLLPVLAFWIPFVQSLSFKGSSTLGPRLGPFITETFTTLPLLFLSFLEVIDGSGKSLKDSSVSMNLVRGLGALAILRGFEKLSTTCVLKLLESGYFGIRSGLQLFVAALYAACLPSRSLFLALPAIMHAVTYNVHFPLSSNTASLNQTLQRNTDIAILARHESTTGYISVLQNVKQNYRVLRCDHSLLGGEWIYPPKGYENTSKVREPVYAVFVMMEAVRLIHYEGDESADEQEHDLEDARKRLGIGTTSTALVSHGINTTTVEIDPLLERLATRYFGLPKNHTTVVDDAVQYVDKALHGGAQRDTYDYIIHDVFTGGAEPVNLFTLEFLNGLSALLKPTGAIAINYAGDLILPSARLVIRTILAVFPTCRIFREDEGPTSSSFPTSDFTNMVIFCTKTSAPLVFREPREEDYLGSYARRAYLSPKHEIDQSRFARKGGDEDADVLTKRNTAILTKWHRESAVGHWWIMRTVLPAEVWEKW
ncbi:MAG: hypothetical protein M1833_001646 [Piccolia ochrophora]|nr:MAG: hypothetical protein M1833_001646 [Piccolia ochrophora]